MLPLVPACADAYIALDGKVLDWQGGVWLEGKCMVPVRPIFQELGYKLTSDMEQGVVQANKGQEKIVIHLWQPKVLHNGSEFSGAGIPQLIEGRTMLYAEDLSRLLGLTLSQEPASNAISFFTKPEMTQEGIVGHLFTADRMYLRAEYYNNQDFLIEHHVAPSPVLVTKYDLEQLLGNYWSPVYIDRLWQDGSEQGRYVGFYSEGSIPLSYSKEIFVSEITPTGARVEVTMPDWWEEDLNNLYKLIYTLSLDEQGRLVITDLKYLE